VSFAERNLKQKKDYKNHMQMNKISASKSYQQFWVCNKGFFMRREIFNKFDQKNNKK